MTSQKFHSIIPDNSITTETTVTLFYYTVKFMWRHCLLHKGLACDEGNNLPQILMAKILNLD